MNKSFTEDESNIHKNKKIRVLMAVPQYPYPVLGGLERQAHELSMSLIKKGIIVQVLSGKTHESQMSREFVEGILVHRIPWSQRKWIRFIRSPLDLFLVLIKKRNEFDIVHLHQYSWFSLYVLFVSKMLGKYILIKLPNGSGLYGVYFIKESRMGWLKMILFKSADAVVAITKDSIQELVNIGFPAKRILFSPNGVRINKELPHNIKNNGLQEICRVVFIGTLNEEKGIFDLLYAWREVLANTHKKVKLEFWGTGPLENKLREFEFSKSPSVIFISAP